MGHTNVIHFYNARYNYSFLFLYVNLPAVLEINDRLYIIQETQFQKMWALPQTLAGSDI